MASTYTTNKAIEKPGYNDYVNSWNVPVNNDWDIIDKCFGGTYSISTTGGTTNISQTNCQNVYILVTGALSSNAILTIPSGVGGFFIFGNGTTGAYTLTVSSLGGGTSAAVVQGSRAFLFSDGTNVFFADDSRVTSYVASVSFGSTGLTPATASTGAIVVAGTLAVANGGTGTTTSTGTGSVVLSASPTLTGTISGANASFSGTLGVTGTLTGTTANFTTTNSSGTISVTDTGTLGANIKLVGNGATTPNKYLGCYNGQFRIVSSAYSVALITVDDSGNLVATGNVTAYSDSRLKKDVLTIANALEKVKQLRGVEFTRIDTNEKGTGLIAQDVQAIMPQAIQEGEYLSVAYGNLVGLLVEAIKDLSLEVDKLKVRG
jgi:hypothetical protein